jgi:ABC-type nitrate/sulfonate/bicarbonate transport system permease component
MDRQGERMEALTRSLNRLTWAIAIATFIGVALTAWTLLSGA